QTTVHAVYIRCLIPYQSVLFLVKLLPTFQIINKVLSNFHFLLNENLSALISVEFLPLSASNCYQVENELSNKTMPYKYFWPVLARLLVNT
ncbi:MAG: hypothetical protein KAI44_04560, partial [Methylococcales bacterium]|nr:hypothetical protein [Methylococcales bacterium]